MYIEIIDRTKCLWNVYEMKDTLVQNWQSRFWQRI